MKKIDAKLYFSVLILSWIDLKFNKLLEVISNSLYNIRVRDLFWYSGRNTTEVLFLVWLWILIFENTHLKLVCVNTYFEASLCKHLFRQCKIIDILFNVKFNPPRLWQKLRMVSPNWTVTIAADQAGRRLEHVPMPSRWIQDCASWDS